MTPARLSHAAESSAPDFDRVARLYRWLEYGTFGRSLARCRYRFLPTLLDRRKALLLGDGDGRFLSRLLAANKKIEVTAVDGSRAMLALSRKRVEKLGAAERVTFQHADARAYKPAPGSAFDLVVTHFFLDCLTEAEIADLAATLAAHTTPRALWLVSEFAAPASQPQRMFGRIVVRALYFAFRRLTGLRVRQLPDHGRVLRALGWECRRAQASICGILRSELWRRQQEPL